MLHWWRKASDVLHRHAVRVIQTQVLVQHRKDLVVENLELADAVHHLLQWLNNTSDDTHHHHQHFTHSTHDTNNLCI